MKDWRRVPVDGVDITYTWRGWEIWCAWPSRSRNDIDTLIRIEYTGAEAPGLVRSTRRLNLISNSAVEAIGVAMRRVTPKDKDIDRFIAEMAEDLIGWYKKGQATTYPEPAQRNGAGWLIYPVWPKAGITAVAAAGGSYKSFIAQALALQLTTGTEILAGNTKAPIGTTKVLYLDWEADEGTFSERLYAIQRGAGLDLDPVLAYKSMRVPLVDAVGGLQDEIRAGRFGAVVIDSMSASVGGDLIDAAHVNSFFDSVRQLGVPALVLAHKSAESAQKRSARFFGSIMSENRVRLAWNGEKASDGETVVWEVFKDNNQGRWGDKLAWTVAFDSDGEDEHRRLSAVTLQGCNPHNVNMESDAAIRVHDKVMFRLLEGPALVAEIAESIGSKHDTVKAVLNRKKTMFAKRSDGRWEPRSVARPDPM